jgi:hypothetical protein
MQDRMSTLLAGYQAADAGALRELYSLLRPLIRAHLLVFGADERTLDALLDEVFLQIHAARRTWNPESPVEPWATAIAEHVLGRRAGWRPARSGRMARNGLRRTWQTVENVAEWIRQVRR